MQPAIYRLLARSDAGHCHSIDQVGAGHSARRKSFASDFIAFRKECSGNVAVIFSLALMPIIGLVGTAVDYSRANSIKAGMQAALDATALMLAKEASGLSAAQLSQKADLYFKANFQRSDTNSVKLNVTHTSIGNISLTISGATTMKTAVMGVMGVPTLEIASSSTVRWSDATFEIALVLDNSSSMAESFGGKSKVDAAKAAASALVDVIFESPGTSGKSKVAVVPYTSAVNVGAEYKTASWVDTNGQSSIHWQNITKPAGATSRFTLYEWLDEPWGGCFETRPNGLGLTDSQPLSGDSLFVPMFAPDEPGNKLATSYSGDTVMNSYLNDDGQGACSGNLPSDWASRQKLGCKYNINKDSGKVAYKTQWGIKTGPNFMCNAVKLLRLSASKAATKNKIDELKALGDTSIFEGVAWGWRTLTPNAPFADGRPYQGNTPENKKILILLSDGNNNWLQLDNPNRSLYAPMGFYPNNRLETGINTQSAANDMLNAKTKQVCENAKQKGVLIYTVGIKLPGTSLPASWADLITKCASTVDGTVQSFIATNGSQLVDIFKEIGARVTKLRITS